MKKKSVFAAFLFAGALLVSCATGAGKVPADNKSTQQATESNAKPLDAVIKEMTESIMSRIPQKTRIAILNIEAESDELSGYIVQELENCFGENGSYTFIDRQNTAVIQGELEFQANGLVNDESAQKIGNMYGASTIVYGKISSLGNEYRLTLYATEAETAVTFPQTKGARQDTRFSNALQDLDMVINRAVSQLGKNTAQRLSIAVGRIGLNGTQTVTNLSDFLKGRIVHQSNQKNSPFQVSLDYDEAVQAFVEGSFNPLGDGVEVLLQLVSNPGKKVLGTSNKFVIPGEELRSRKLSVLPPKGDEIIKKTEYDEKQSILSPYQKKGAFTITMTPDHRDAIYYEGDLMSFQIVSDKDCYFKISHVDVDGNVQVIYPRSSRDHNFIRMGEKRQIPDNTKFRMGKPYGEEYILFAAYSKPFDVSAKNDAESSTKISRDVIKNSLSARGLDVEETDNSFNADTGLAPVAFALFNYTVLPRK
jgi:hypothetical protein